MSLPNPRCAVCGERLDARSRKRATSTVVFAGPPQWTAGWHLDCPDPRYDRFRAGEMRAETLKKIIGLRGPGRVVERRAKQRKARR